MSLIFNSLISKLKKQILMKKMFSKGLLLSTVLLLLISCKKEEPACWYCIDSIGNNVPDICGKTSKEIKDQYPSYTCTKR